MAHRRSMFLALALGLACSSGSVDEDEGGDGDDQGGSADAGIDDADLPRDVTVVVDLGKLGRTLPADLVGLSIEYPLVGPYLGRDPAQMNPAFQHLLENLGTGVLRVGGGTTDTSCWRTDPGAPLPSGCNIEISSNSLRIIAKTMQETGWRALLGVDLNHYSPSTALDYARDGIAPAFAGSGLFALEFGSEPDQYVAQGRRPSTYTHDAFIKEWKAYADAIHGNASTASLRFVGPAYGARSRWFDLLPAFLSSVGDRLHGGGVSIHDYPLTRCNGEVHTVEDLMAEGAIDESAKKESTAAEAAAVSGAGLIVDQAGNISCNGTDGVSNRFASALWGLDFLLTLAEAGADRVDFHNQAGSYFDPIVSIESQEDGKWVYSTRVLPLYYAMLLASRAGGGRFLESHVTEGSFALSTHAVRAGDGTTLVYLINKDTEAGGAVAVTPSEPHGAASAIRLRAPDLEAGAGEVTLGGQKVDEGTGRIGDPDTEEMRVASTSGTYLVDLPVASAVLLVIPAE
jgi:hypothetical protein